MTGCYINLCNNILINNKYICLVNTGCYMHLYKTKLCTINPTHPNISIKEESKILLLIIKIKFIYIKKLGKIKVLFWFVKSQLC